MTKAYDWESYIAARLHVSPESVPSWKVTTRPTTDVNGNEAVEVHFPGEAPDLDYVRTSAIEEDDGYTFDSDHGGEYILLPWPDDL